MKNYRVIISIIPAILFVCFMAFYFLPQSDVEASINAYNIPAIDHSPASIYDADVKMLEKLTLNVSDEEFKCLAKAVYFEARSEPLEGQVAVAYVILNRVKDKRYPDNICGVVFQNERRRNMCQFSFACDGLSDNPHEKIAWDIARRVASGALVNDKSDVTGRSTHYHATYVYPTWAKHLQPTIQVGQHIFYREDS